MSGKHKKCNKWNLERKIPPEVKQEVRKRCGFGCVICGNALIEYHHSTTKYHEAQEHNPNEIVLLCGYDHSRVTRGRLSDEAVEEASQIPKCLQTGFSFDPFDIGQSNLEVIAGSVTAINTKILIQVFGQPIFGIDHPESENAPFRINAIFCDKKGNESLLIEDNEFQILTQNWDAEIKGKRIIIRRGSGDFALRLRTEPRKAIVIEKLNMLYKGVQIICEENKHLTVKMPDDRFIKSGYAKIQDCEVGFDILTTGISVGTNCKEQFYETLKIVRR